jgi:hypothetical protein
MKAWEKLEHRAVDYLNRNNKYESISYILRGGSNSKISDIEIISSALKLPRYIEVKGFHAHCGQFVVVGEVGNLRLSDKCQIDIDEVTIKIISKLNELDYESLNNSYLEISKELLLEKIIRNHKDDKSVDFWMFPENDEFIITPTKNIGRYYDFLINIRKKKSGSANLPLCDFNLINDYIKESYNIKEEVFKSGKKTFISMTENSGIVESTKFTVNGNYYFLVPLHSEKLYKITKLSNTNNLTVLFKCVRKQL